MKTKEEQLVEELVCPCGCDNSTAVLKAYAAGCRDLKGSNRKQVFALMDAAYKFGFRVGRETERDDVCNYIMATVEKGAIWPAIITKIGAAKHRKK